METRPVRRADPTEHQSPSKLDLWTRCQFAWAQRYIERVKRAPSQSQALGRAIDETWNDFYRAKMRDDANLPEDEVTDRFENHWMAEASEVEEMLEVDRSTLLDRGIAMARVWYRKAAQFVEPLGVQLEVDREVRSGDERVILEGKLDLLERRADGTRAVVDHKIGGRSYGVAELYRSTQALVYAFCTGASTFGIHAGVLLKASEKFQAVYREVTESDAKLLGNQALIAQRQQRAAMRSGDFFPNRGHQFCARSWCTEWRTCERTFGGRVPA